MVIEPHGQIVGTRARGRFGIAATAVLASAFLLTGCAAGEHAQTGNEVPVVDGVTASAGPIDIRAAGITAPQSGSGYAAGSDVTVKLVLVNTGNATVALRSVSSPGAQQGTLGINGPADTANTSASGGQGATIAIPSNGSVQVGYSTLGPTVTLVHLAQPLYPSQTLPVTFNFSDGSTVTATLAVQLTSGANDAPTVDIAPPGQG